MNRTLSLIINFSLLLFPLSVNLLKHAGSSILLILTVCGILTWFFQQRPVAINRAEKWVMVCFAGYFGVAMIFLFGHGLLNEAIELKWGHDGESRMLALIPIFYAFIYFDLKQAALWYGLSLGALSSGIYSLLFVLVFHAGTRATGGYHAIAFGDLSLLFGFMSLAGIDYFYKKHPLLVTIPLLAVIGGIIATLLSATRGAVIAIPPLLLITFIQFGSHSKKHLLVFAVIFSLIIAAGSYFIFGSTVDKRFREGIRENSSLLQGKASPREALRLRMWIAAFRIIKDNPLTGVGHGGYRAIIEKKAAHDPSLENIKHFNSPHNMFILNMVDYGISGLIISIALFFSPLLIYLPHMRKNDGTANLAFAGLILTFSYFLFAMTESLFTRYIFISPFLILNGALMALCHLSTRGITVQSDQ